MREILFRGKRIDNGDWIYGDLIQNVDAVKIREHEIELDRIAKSYEVNPDTVGQYTGLTDKNGRKIFEGDIIKYHDDYTPVDITFKVVYEDAGFFVRGDNTTPHLHTALSTVIAEKSRIIGCIHDNPELLGGDGDE